MKKNRTQELALQKLQIAEMLFDQLNFNLSWNQEILDSKQKTLALCARKYSSGREDDQYSACTKLYKEFGVSRVKKVYGVIVPEYPEVRKKLKEWLRETSKFFITKNFKLN